MELGHGPRPDLCESREGSDVLGEGHRHWPGQPLGYGYRPAVRRFVTAGELLKQGEVREWGEYT